jgi:site-specific DNA-methyltransferase (adenine-specific)
MKVKISDIIVKQDRQRKTYTKAGIDSLAVSLSTNGQINPLAVNRESDGTLTLLAGERRLIAAKQLNWTEIEVTEFADLNELQREEIELDENLQRENLPWQEEVAAKRRIWEIRAKLYGETVKEVAEHVGMSHGSLWEDARLAQVMEEVPELKLSKNKTQAMSKLRLLKRRMALEELASRGSVVPVGGEDYSGRVHQGDCVEIMKEWPNGIIHCVITDPPYGIDLGEGQTKKSSNHPTIYADDHYDIMEVVALAAREAYRLLVDNSHAYFWFDIKAYSSVFKLLTDVGFTVDPIPLVWTKNVPGQANHPDSRWASGYEACFFCRKGQRAMLKQGQSNVLHYDVVPSGKKIHPVEKPTNLLRQLIETSTVPGEVILDMFGGSGSTAEAAIQMGRNFITIEKDPAFHAGIIERLSHTKEASGGGGGLDEDPIDVISDDDDEEDDIAAAMERHRK